MTKVHENVNNEEQPLFLGGMPAEESARLISEFAIKQGRSCSCFF